MTEDDILKNLFEFNGKYEKDKLYFFEKDENFLDYLKNKLAGVYDFINNSEIKYSSTVPLAGITIDKKTGKPLIYLNPNRITHFYHMMYSGKIEITFFYRTLSAILWHESLHVILKHFSHPQIFSNSDNEKWNIVQDIFIDNLIHSIYPGWRNWKDYIDNKINNEIEKQKLSKFLKKISLDQDITNPDYIYIKHINDTILYNYLNILNISTEPQNEKRFDTHFEEHNEDFSTKGEEQREDSDDNSKNDDLNSEKNSDKQNKKEEQENNTNSNKNEDSSETNENETRDKEETSKCDDPKNKKNSDKENEDKKNDSSSDKFNDFFDKLEKEARKRNEERDKKPLADKDFSDIITQKATEGRKYSLLNILQKYIKKINYKQKINTWKKTSRKLYRIRPGIIHKKQPGEIIIIVDTSGSMVYFLKYNFKNIIEGIYKTFIKISKVYGNASKMFYLEADQKITETIEIKKNQDIEAITEKALKGGGGTDYKPVFDWIIENWHKYSSQKVPDLVIFITDFGTDLNFLKDEKYNIFNDRNLLWLSTVKYDIIIPKGKIIPIYPDDFGANYGG